MLICMTINHLPSSLRFLTDRSLGIFSAAEGFIFLSGIMAGWVYTRRRRREGQAGLWSATRGRATMIYRWQIGGFLCALAAVRLTDWWFGFCSQNSPLLFYQHPFEAIGLGLVLLYQPGMLDILPIYCAFVVALPWVLDRLEEGKRGLILTLSIGAWLLVQFAPPTDGGPYYPIVTSSFNILAWQLLFFIGVMVGHAKADPQKDFMRFRPWLFLLALALAIYGYGIAQLHWRTPGSDDLFGRMLNKPALGFDRLVDFLAFAYLVGMFGKHFPKALTWKPVAFLGQHSIAVFSVQSVVAITLCEFDNLFSTPARNYTTTAIAVALLWVSAAVHERLQRRARGGSGADSAPVRAGQLPPGTVSPRHDLRAV